MILSIYFDPKFKKKLNELQWQGGISSFIAQKASNLIDRLLLRGRDCSREIGKLTKNGEFRIKNCKKYDLGNGYRLVCLRKGPHLILLYIGTHDECSRWLERNQGLRYEINYDCKDHVFTKELPTVNSLPVNEIDPADQYEEELLKQLDDKILRKIFCGLCVR